MEDELKPCPCCGSTNVHAYNSKAAQYRQYSIKCKKCGLRVCKATLAEATDVWNQRTERTAKVKLQDICWEDIRRYKEGMCASCGRSVYDHAKYCDECGCRLEWDE